METHNRLGDEAGTSQVGTLLGRQGHVPAREDLRYLVEVLPDDAANVGDARQVPGRVLPHLGDELSAAGIGRGPLETAEAVLNSRQPLFDPLVRLFDPLQDLAPSSGSSNQGGKRISSDR
ncbi:MAG: hypothetical protein ACLPYW_09465 [Acidimicrobiales bacterium]